MNNRFRCASVIVLFALILPASAAAHPHIFIEATARVEFSARGPEAVHVRWAFDQFFSRMIALDFAGSGTGPFNAEQVESIRKGAFINLEHYNYFIHILADGQEIPISQVKDFHAELDGRTLVYRFTIPLAQPGGPDAAVFASTRELVIGLYDDSFYSAFDYPQSPISFSGDLPVGLDYSLEERPDRRYYFNLITPEMFHIRWN
ncbi:DUF1007 family protein [Spirochaeta dissipatitropha]